MTLGTLVIYIGIAALILTVLIGIFKKGHRSWVMTFLQNFTGVLFLVSGWVKAVDPMGTAFKMEQYFAEFEATLSGTWFDFAASLFPWLSSHAIAFSVFMIVLEMIVGLMLVLGHRAKLASWVFLLTIVFFTILTGFTFLTGYVPGGANFFSFGEWSNYDPNNMRVTDCGCFGDFIKLEPRTSFFKDIVLLVPALIFVFRHKDMHVLLPKRTGNIVMGLATAGLLLYCFSNYVWDLPHADFRPFKKGVNVAAQKAAEDEAASSVQITDWILENKSSGESVALANDDYMKNYQSYPSEEWEIVDQKKSEPAIPITKISDFEVLASDGMDMTTDILESGTPTCMIVCYKLYGEVSYEEVMRQDTVYRIDTVAAGDSLQLVQVVDRVDEVLESVAVYSWDEDYIKKFTEKLLPFTQAAEADGVQPFLVAGGASGAMLADFAKAIGTDMPMFEADDILLKTIVRSNPGPVLMKDGEILDKWHIKKLPDWSEASGVLNQ